MKAREFTKGKSVKDKRTTKDENESRQACSPGQLGLDQDEGS